MASLIFPVPLLHPFPETRILAGLGIQQQSSRLLPYPTSHETSWGYPPFLVGSGLVLLRDWGLDYFSQAPLLVDIEGITTEVFTKAIDHFQKQIFFD